MPGNGTGLYSFVPHRLELAPPRTPLNGGQSVVNELMVRGRHLQKGANTSTEMQSKTQQVAAGRCRHSHFSLTLFLPTSGVQQRVAFCTLRVALRSCSRAQMIENLCRWSMSAGTVPMINSCQIGHISTLQRRQGNTTHTPPPPTFGLSTFLPSNMHSDNNPFTFNGSDTHFRRSLDSSHCLGMCL